MRGAPCSWSSAARWWWCSPSGRPSGLGLAYPRQWGPGSRHVFRSSFYHLKPLFAVTSGPPAPPASATTSTEGRDRCIPFPADRQGHADAQFGARRPARSPSGLGSGKAKSLPVPDVLSRSGSCMPPVEPGREPRLEVSGTNSAATDEAAHRVSVAIPPTAASRSLATSAHCRCRLTAPPPQWRFRVAAKPAHCPIQR